MTPVKSPRRKRGAQAVTRIRIQEQTYTQLARAAQAQQLSAEALAEKIIREHLRAIEQQEMAREIEAYAAQHAQILEKYRGEYIAMYQGEIVDHDKGITELFERIDQRFPDETVLLKEVKEQIDEVINIPSFRILSE